MTSQHTSVYQSDYQMVAGVIQYLHDYQESQPSLQAIAAHVGVSPWHLQRTFTRWAGVSPKRFLQFLTLQHAKVLLDQSRPILDAAYEAGLSGPSRLHDLFVTVESVTPGEYKGDGSALSISYGRHATPFGNCFVATTERGVCALSFLDGLGLDRMGPDSVGPNGNRMDEAVADLRKRWPGAELALDSELTGRIIERIFYTCHGGTRYGEVRQPLTLYLKGTNFQLKVWEALLRIPDGAVTTYGDVAKRIDAPNASRAVGSAVGSNPVAYLIPCHRVIRSSGALSNYRWGLTRKQAILSWEAAQAERVSIDS